MLQSKEYLDCQLGPNDRGDFVTIKMDLMDYEIMCKHSNDFCNCDTGSISSDVDMAAKDNVLNEVYLTRTVTETVYKDRIDSDIINMEKGSNQLAFVMGISITLLLVAVAALMFVTCLRRKMANAMQKIVVRER